MNYAVIGAAFAGGFILGLIVRGGVKKTKKAPVAKNTRESRPALSSRPQQPMRNLFVGNLTEDITEQDLRETFEVFGEVKEVRIIKNRDTGEKKQYGFVHMTTTEDAATAIEHLNGRDLKGSTLVVNYSKGRSQGGNRPRRGNFRRRPSTPREQ